MALFHFFHISYFSFTIERISVSLLFILFFLDLVPRLLFYAIYIDVLFLVELLEQPDASARMNQQLVDRIVPHIKLALCSETRFEAGLNCLEVLSQVVQEGLNVHLKGLMQQLAKKSSKGKIRERVMDVLQARKRLE